MENISVTKCNNLSNIEHLIFFLLIDNEFDLKITLRISNPENHQVCKLIKIRKMLLFSISFSVSIENQNFFLLLPCRILKLIVDMVNDSTSLFRV